MFARLPERGVVKTRLAARVGDDRALAVYRGLGKLIYSRVRPYHPSQAAVTIIHTPDNGGDEVGSWLGENVPTSAQGEGDLGERMTRAFKAAFDAGADRVAVVGTDCPELDRRVLEKALDSLDSHDVVFGPAQDGGYYLVAVHRRAAERALPALFRDIPWSSPTTLAVSLSHATAVGLSVAQLATLSDIDTAEDWLAWQERLKARGQRKPEQAE